MLSCLTDLRVGLTDLHVGLTDMRSCLTDLRVGLTDLRVGLTDMRSCLTDIHVGLIDLLCDFRLIASGRLSDRLKKALFFFSSSGYRSMLQSIGHSYANLHLYPRCVEGDALRMAIVCLDSGGRTS